MPKGNLPVDPVGCLGRPVPCEAMPDVADAVERNFEIFAFKIGLLG